MAVIRPFRAYRPKKGLEDKIAALPYDVYNREEACAAVKDNPHTQMKFIRKHMICFGIGFKMEYLCRKIDQSTTSMSLQWMGVFRQGL